MTLGLAPRATHACQIWVSLAPLEQQCGNWQQVGQKTTDVHRKHLWQNLLILTRNLSLSFVAVWWQKEHIWQHDNIHFSLEHLKYLKHCSQRVNALHTIHASCPDSSYRTHTHTLIFICMKHWALGGQDERPLPDISCCSNRSQESSTAGFLWRLGRMCIRVITTLFLVRCTRISSVVMLKDLLFSLSDNLWE